MKIFGDQEFAYYLLGLGFRTRNMLRKAGWPRDLVYRGANPRDTLSLTAGAIVSDGKGFRAKLTTKTAAAYKTLELIDRINAAIRADGATHELALYCVMLGECQAVTSLDGGVLDPRMATLRKSNAARRAKVDQEILARFASYRVSQAIAATLEDMVERFARQPGISKRHRKRIRELLVEGSIPPI